ncbi:MAG TPA: hypothetical protein VMS08_06250 [Candidatus Saccharimonadia bacterium]|nr:hypothetical protein [Candidatus Saccharimonadia bacterium]
MTFVLIAPDQNLNNYPMNFGSSLSATLSSTQNNYSPTGLNAGINCLYLTAASGGSVITGLSNVGFPDGWGVLIMNLSTTDIISFSHLSASSSVGNKFSCPQGVTAYLQPLTNVIVSYKSGQWVFA